jgi:hypothetical protein
MTAQERTKAVAALGFTERQARFLVTVMTHSGVCLPRQYTAFAGIVYGQKTRRFFAKLVADGHASTCRCLHNRAAVYHVHGRALYRASGVPHSRLRRPVPLGAVVPRLMLLDALLARLETVWWPAGEEAIGHLRSTAPGAAEDSGFEADLTACARLPYGLESLRIGVEPDGSLAILFVVTPAAVTSFRSFFRRVGAGLGTVPRWRIRLVHAREFEAAATACEATVRRALTAFPGRLLRALDDIARRVEREHLPHSYGHLIPLASASAAELRAVGRVLRPITLDRGRRASAENAAHSYVSTSVVEPWSGSERP